MQLTQNGNSHSRTTVECIEPTMRGFEGGKNGQKKSRIRSFTIRHAFSSSGENALPSFHKTENRHLAIAKWNDQNDLEEPVDAKFPEKKMKLDSG